MDRIDFSRDDFMNFFRNDESLAQLSVDDRLEIFSYILPGSSDITVDLLNSLLEDYNVSNILISEINHDSK